MPTAGNFFNKRIVDTEEAWIANVTDVAAIIAINTFPEILAYHLTAALIRSRIENHLVELIPLVLDILFPSYPVLGDVLKQFTSVTQFNQHRILCTGVS